MKRRIASILAVAFLAVACATVGGALLGAGMGAAVGATAGAVVDIFGR